MKFSNNAYVKHLFLEILLSAEDEKIREIGALDNSNLAGILCGQINEWTVSTNGTDVDTPWTM